MFRTRREMEAQYLVSKAARRRAAPHRDPSVFEVIVGLSSFVAVCALCLCAISFFGR